jgi:hypothetical protein
VRWGRNLIALHQHTTLWQIIGGQLRSAMVVLLAGRAFSNRIAMAAVLIVLGLAAIYWPPLGGLLGPQRILLRDWLWILPLSVCRP